MPAGTYSISLKSYQTDRYGCNTAKQRIDIYQLDVIGGVRPLFYKFFDTRSGCPPAAVAGTNLLGGTVSFPSQGFNSVLQCIIINEGGTAPFSCPSFMTFSEIRFASYGTSYEVNGAGCESYSTSGCHALNSSSIVNTTCLGRSTCSLSATNAIFGDPCVGTMKRLVVRAVCTSSLEIGGVSWIQASMYGIRPNSGSQYIEMELWVDGNPTTLSNGAGDTGAFSRHVLLEHIMELSGTTHSIQLRSERDTIWGCYSKPPGRLYAILFPDYNECSLQNGHCDPSVTCYNTQGSYYCGECPVGYEGTARFSQCQDRNECNFNNGGCDTRTLCTNSPGSFSCGSCPQGFNGDGYVGCTDINECLTGNGGCHTLTNCTNTPGSRTCGLCPTGFSGDGYIGCTDINECNVTNGNCVYLCNNTIGSYYCSPYLINGVINFPILGDPTNPPQFNASIGAWILSTIQGGDVVEIQFRDQTPGVFANLDLTSDFSSVYIKYCWLAPNNQSCLPEYGIQPCLNETRSVVGNTYYVRCTMPPSMGGPRLSFFFGVCYSLIECHEKMGQSLTFAFPPPVILPYSLRPAFPQSTREFNASFGFLNARDYQPEVLLFEASNYFIDEIAVYYGASTNPRHYNCTVQPQWSNSTTLACETQDGARGVDNRFSIFAKGWFITGTDTYNYPEAPFIYSVRGCTDLVDTTFDCPTRGGVLITVEGAAFIPPSNVLINGRPCITNGTSTTSLIHCVLPAGAGSSPPVVVSANSIFSPPSYRLSYAPPTVDYISGCTQVDNKTIIDCDRIGGNNITLVGANFGSQDAKVLIGSKECLNVQHIGIPIPGTNNSDYHSMLNCTLDQGSGAALDVIVIQDAGSVKITGSLVSYSQCLPGSKESGLDCLLCQPGEYSALGGSCDRCPLGAWSNATGATACQICPGGTASGSLPGATQCVKCSSGRYAQQNGSVQCFDCLPGKAAPDRPGNAGATTCVDCGIGTYQESAAKTSCTPCPRGTSQAALGQRTCEVCTLGRFAAYTGLPTCAACQQGRFQPNTGKTTCSACPLGNFQSGYGAPNCVPCDRGSVVNVTGATGCLVCQPGFFQEQSGGTACKECPLGRSSTNPLLCTDCSEGRYSNKLTSTECTPCPPGRAQEGTGATGCDTCQIGTQSQGLTECIPCDARSIAPQNETEKCTVCDPNSSPNKQRTLCSCKQGTFMLNNTCRQCPLGTVCNSSGITFNDMATASGFWRPNNQSLSYFKCLLPYHCQGGVNSDCGPHRDGPICALCQEGYQTSSGIGGVCAKCPSKNAAIGLSVVFFFIAVVVLCILYWIVLRSEREIDDAFERPKHGYRGTLCPEVDMAFAGFAKQDIDADTTQGLEYTNVKIPLFTQERRVPANVMYSMKIVLGFFQITTNLRLLTHVPWPRVYETFVGYLDFVNIDFVPWQSVGCVAFFDYYSRLLVITITPVVIFIALVLFFLVPTYIMDRLDFSDLQERRMARKKTRRTFWKLILFTLFLMYPSISFRVLMFFLCRNIDGTPYLVADFNVKCYDDRWNRYMPVIVAMVVIYPFGIPAMFFQRLWQKSDNIRDPAVRQSLGFLFAAYQYTEWWFEIVDMLHKLTLTSLIAFFPVQVKLPAAMSITTSYTMLILVRRPYLRKADDTLHLLAQVELLLLLMAAHILSVLNRRTLDLATDIALGSMLIVLSCAFVVFFVIRSFWLLRKIFRNRQRDKALDIERRTRSLGDKTPQRRHSDSDTIGDDEFDAEGNYIGKKQTEEIELIQKPSPETTLEKTKPVEAQPATEPQTPEQNPSGQVAVVLPSYPRALSSAQRGPPANRMPSYPQQARNPRQKPDGGVELSDLNASQRGLPAPLPAAVAVVAAHAPELCQECEEIAASIYCAMCNQYTCAACDASNHKEGRGDSQHSRQPIR